MLSSSNTTVAEKIRRINTYFARHYHEYGKYDLETGNILVEEVRATGPYKPLWITTAAALLEHENGARNVFGADWGTIGKDVVPFARLPVTRERVEKLLAHNLRGGLSNGVGHGQPTYKPLLAQIEGAGGAHHPRYQMRYCFRMLNDLLNNPMLTFEDAIEMYNDGRPGNDPSNPYDVHLARRMEEWKVRLWTP